MSFLEVTGIYILALLKISCEMLIGLICVVITMIAIRFIKKDKCYFTKKFLKFRRYIYGINFRHCK
ncbi:hypothetical protein [uncultured Clostridium sp.]|uniref:hypothetical protein n=1 Tax=uncultured Clostridium sp. TaxID=59620 RepID=UPI00280B347B|nr:hypothetical protein [uncultured Clostridium sp.]